MDCVSKLIDHLTADKVIIGDQVKDRYPHIWYMDTPLLAKAVILPTTTNDVSAICKICNEYKQPIVLHGGLTNLVGSTIATENDIVVSLEKLDQIIEVDEEGRTMTVEAGVILEHVQNAAKEKDMLFPLNFGAKGTAQIGGCISSNAGGMRVLKYGMTRNQILGIEGVLPDGTIINSLKKIIKDNSGYDIKQLLIGGEGTLGVVTKAVLRLREKPISRNCAYIGFDDFKQVTSFLKYIDKALGGKLSCFEIMWKSTYMTLTSPPSLLSPPLEYKYNYYVLIEALGGSIEQDNMHFNEVLEVAIESDLILDAAIANSSSDLNWFFNIREDVAVLKAGPDFDQHFDISLPINEISDYVEITLSTLNELKQVSKAFAFGHLADGNIHFIVMKRSLDNELKEKINKIVYGPLLDLQGSVSAEHGIGLDKRAYLHLSRSHEEITIMKLLKRTFDPNNILNPNRIFDINQ